jgi:hypothetical protein
MTSLPVRAATAVAIACIAAAAAPLTPASADPPSNGCPRGYDLLSVAPLSEAGYLVPGMVDSPTTGVHSFGRPGNGDGFVCGVPLGNQTWINGQIYNFWDNTLQT